jgi:hypothetical protein
MSMSEYAPWSASLREPTTRTGVEREALEKGAAANVGKRVEIP